jgi:tetratricopeptide (TPR) repeat protein
MKQLLLCILLTFTHVSFSQKSINYNQKAEEYLKKGNYKEAVPLLTLALKLIPKDVSALRNRAMCYERLEKFDLALKDNLELLKLDKSASTLGSIGYDYLWLEKYDEARKFLNEAIIIAPSDIIFHYNKALTYQYADNFEQAIIAYDEALMVDPNHMPSLVSKTRCLLKSKLYDKASAIVDTFFIQKKFDVEMLLFRGDIKKHFGKIEDALHAYNRAIAINPDDIFLLEKTARCLNELGLYEEEIEIRKREIEIQFNKGEKNDVKSITFATLAIAQEAAGYFEEAQNNYSESIKLDPTGGDGRVYFLRCILNAKMKDFEGACKDLAKSKEFNPDNAGEYDQYFEEDEEFEEFVKYCMPNP